MENEKVINLMALISGKIPADREFEIQEALKSVPDEKLALLTSTPFKKPSTTTLLAIFLGGWGVDRFILGETGMGVLKILTAGVCGIMWLIDIFTASNRTKEHNYKELLKRM